MRATIQPYLYFEGRCEEAIAFYGTALGARVEALMRFSDAPAAACGGEAGEAGASDMPRPDPAGVMHAELRIGEAVLLCSDGFGRGEPRFAGFSLALLLPDAAAVDAAFAALAEGGAGVLPPHETFFSRRFAMVTDRFGVGWSLWTAAAAAVGEAA
ncbi:glyoxalase/bleomycin resistance/extradiol dioxygenase family protein [Ancylobacter lacus]|nr:glyoxalase/bleomycin resistance/extradiol dioxygenase family protein [Ancylobacter lacus]